MKKMASDKFLLSLVRDYVGIGEIVDRLVIARLTLLNNIEFDKTTELDRLNITKTTDVWNQSTKLLTDYGVDANMASLIIDKLTMINSRIWGLESELRKGNGGKLSLADAGFRALEIRDLNISRVKLKEEINRLVNWK